MYILITCREPCLSADNSLEETFYNIADKAEAQNAVKYGYRLEEAAGYI